MRYLWIFCAAALAGCASEERIEKRPPSMDAISGKTLEAYMQCVVPELKDSRSKS
ncbi:hypothetical protein GCM10009425_38430 [Pseudomonas asuensis]|uniref:Entry exclusion lipoprotein TrbK n=1 Tax=Pseudomonas asuensis TaxID=1825787 RepID=A0ABQ2H203_9PSED|nr:hypothetical protein GCM10009425_38430 [Pseudomonas asuensis]